MDENLPELALRCSFTVPSHWQCGTDLTVSDEIQLPPDPSEGLWGRWLRLLGQNPPQKLARTLKIVGTTGLVLRLEGRTWTWAYAEIRRVTIQRFRYQYHYDCCFDEEYAALAGDGFSLMLKAVDFSSHHPQWTLEPLARWLEETFGAEMEIEET